MVKVNNKISKTIKDIKTIKIKMENLNWEVVLEMKMIMMIRGMVNNKKEIKGKEKIIVVDQFIELNSNIIINLQCYNSWINLNFKFMGFWGFGVLGFWAAFFC